MGVSRPTGQVCADRWGWSGAQLWGAAVVTGFPVPPLLLATAAWGLQTSMAPHSAVPEQTIGPTVVTRGDPTAVTPMEMPLHPDSLEAAPHQEGGPPGLHTVDSAEGEFVGDVDVMERLVRLVRRGASIWSFRCSRVPLQVLPVPPSRAHVGCSQLGHLVEPASEERTPSRCLQGWGVSDTAITISCPCRARGKSEAA